MAALALPASVRGPVERRALAMLARCWLVEMGDFVLLLAFDVDIVILAFRWPDGAS